MEQRAPRGRGTFLTTIGVVAALAIVAVAARGSTPVGEAGTRRPADRLLDVLVSLYIVGLVAGALLFVYMLLLRKEVIRRRAGAERKQRTLQGLLVYGLFLVAILLVVQRLRTADPRPARIPGIQPPPEAGIAGDPGAGSRYEPEFAWIPVLVVVGLAMVGAAAALWASRARRRALGGFREPSLAEALADVLEDTLDDLRAERDPRRAVIAAYARLERVLAAHGLPRRPAEAPVEYLGRILGELDVGPVAVRRLTALFERAKFSQHDVDPEMKEQAIAALQTVQDELRAAEELARAERAAAVEAARERAAAG